MSTITIDLDNLTAEEQETVKRLAAKKNPYFVPKEQEKYYFCHSDGVVLATYNCSIHDEFEISIGNCFRTREEAEEAKTRLQMQTKWKRLSLEAGEADNPWDGKHNHYFVFWNLEDEILDTDCNITMIFQKTYFPTFKSLKAAISELGEENVKKYILGVEE